MKTKIILSIAIISILPLTTNADPVVSVGPTRDSGNAPIIATAMPPYQTLTPTNDDKQHIASTAYVKGAYNELISAVNKVGEIAYEAQPLVYNEDDWSGLSSTALGKGGMTGYVEEILDDDTALDNDDYITQSFVTASGALGAIKELYDIGRVEVWTTWENDNATKGVKWKTRADFQ